MHKYLKRAGDWIMDQVERAQGEVGNHEDKQERLKWVAEMVTIITTGTAGIYTNVQKLCTVLTGRVHLCAGSNHDENTM